MCEEAAAGAEREQGEGERRLGDGAGVSEGRELTTLTRMAWLVRAALISSIHMALSSTVSAKTWNDFSLLQT